MLCTDQVGIEEGASASTNTARLSSWPCASGLRCGSDEGRPHPIRITNADVRDLVKRFSPARHGSRGGTLVVRATLLLCAMKGQVYGHTDWCAGRDAAEAAMKKVHCRGLVTQAQAAEVLA